MPQGTTVLGKKFLFFLTVSFSWIRLTASAATSLITEAEPAAEAAECASEQNKFWEYTDALFTNQANLGEDLYVKLAKDLKLDLNKFKTCRDSDRALAIINANAQSGAEAGVSGTPGSFIIDQDGNAQEVAGALPLASIKAMIDPLLQ